MTSSEFDKQYKRLNKAQKTAVDSIDGPVMVIAGPGTGKTTILTLRIANILKQTDTPPDSILALTFTDSGAKAMRRKLFDIIGDEAYKVHIHTFHGFASSAISTYGDHFVHLNEMSIMTEMDSEGFISSILENPKFRELRPMGKPEYYISSILRAISDMKKEAVTPEEISVFAKDDSERIKNDEDSISTRGASKGELKAEAKKHIEKCARTEIFADVYSAYEQKKRTEQRMDFDDQIIELLTAMKNDQLFLRLLQEQFLYILVDEHQDTNDSQNMILNMLADFFDNPNLFIVGDEKQAIYRFQGGSVQNFMRLQKIYAGMKMIELSENYRSHQHILDASHSMIGKNYGENDQKIFQTALTAQKENKKRPVEIVVSKKQESEENYLVERLREIVKSEPEETSAIIVRTNREVDRIFGIIERSGLSAFSEKNIDVLSHPLGILFIELLKSVTDASNLENLAKTLAAGLWNISFEQSVSLIREIRSGNLSGVSKNIPAFAYLKNSLPTDGATDFFIRLGEESGFIKHVLKSPEGAEIWRGIIALTEFASNEIGRTDAVSVSERFFLYADSKRKVSIKISVGSEDSVIKVMTAHKSKGLEFDYVFIPYATEESWMKRHIGSHFILPKVGADDESERDSRRLFYVAMTRAKKHAVVLLSEQGIGGDELMQLRFLKELGEKSAVWRDAPENIKTLPAGNTKEKKETRENSERVEYAKRILAEKGLSVTALNHFLECPNKFFFLSILKLPQAPNANSEKGSAMHLAMARIWQKKLKTLKEIEETIKNSVSKYLDGSLLVKNEKEVVREKLLADAPVVARALLPHFLEEGEASAEGWNQELFHFDWKGKHIEIPIHGKLDAVVDNGQEVFVFDYKTKKAISENEIKGLTKNSDGGYFRQLAFYKLLLMGNKKYKEKKILPALVFISPDEKGRCPIVSLPVEEKDIESLKQNIKTLAESVWSGEFLSKKCDDKECEW
ncbi:MAG: ATP-dependent DNA helicase, partial [Candidatus Paceibacterota bacterium]